MREEHLRSRQRKVVCYTCHDKRPTFTCSRCDETGHREDFQKDHFDRDCQRGTQQCLECKSGRRKGKVCVVSTSKKFVLLENLPKAHQHNPKQILICAECLTKGYTVKDTTTYNCTCNQCPIVGGRMLFQDKNFTRALQRKNLKCKKCFMT